MSSSSSSAACSSSSGSVYFEISYSRPSSYPYQMVPSCGRWRIAVDQIDIEVPDGDSHIYTSWINKDFPPFKEQPLKFVTYKKTDILFPDPKTVGRISMKTALAKTMVLSARIFNRDDPNLPISVDSFPEFEPGKCYRIKVVNNDYELKATFVELLEESLDVSELKRRYTAAKKELSTARQNAHEALISGDKKSNILSLAAIDKISDDVKKLGDALERKGVSLTLEEAPKCAQQ